MDCIKDIENLTKDFAMRDHVVILAGSNDIGPGVKSVLSHEVRNKIDAICKYTNVVFSTLPTRYDRADGATNEAIYECNSELCSDELIGGCNVLPFNSFTRSLFTRHGQHLNKAGKKALCSKIIECVSASRPTMQSKDTTSFL